MDVAKITTLKRDVGADCIQNHGWEQGQLAGQFPVQQLLKPDKRRLVLHPGAAVVAQDVADGVGRQLPDHRSRCPPLPGGSGNAAVLLITQHQIVSCHHRIHLVYFLVGHTHRRCFFQAIFQASVKDTPAFLSQWSRITW